MSRLTRRCLLSATLAISVAALAACGGQASQQTPDHALVPARSTTAAAALRTTASPAYRFVGKPLVLGLPDDGPPNTYGAISANVYIHLNRELPGTGPSCAIHVDERGAEECSRSRPLRGAKGVCLHAYLEMKPTDALYHKGSGDQVTVRLELNKGKGRIVERVKAYGVATGEVYHRRIKRFGCPLGGWGSSPSSALRARRQ
jgi:hypothetical protein